MERFVSRWIYGDSLMSNMGYWWFNGIHYLASSPFVGAAKRFVFASNARDWLIYSHERFVRPVSEPKDSAHGK